MEFYLLFSLVASISAKALQPGGGKSWLVPSQTDLGEGIGASEQKGWLPSFNPW